MPTIAVAPLGLVIRDTVARLGSLIAPVFGRDIAIAPTLRLPVDAYDRQRRQYLSRRLLDVLAGAGRPEWERILGVANIDLFAPGLNFVFGEADARRGVALISLWRLRGPGDRIDARSFERAAKEAIHELAHSYGLGHCDDTSCVMWFSNTLAETDRKEMWFCARHQADMTLGARGAEITP